MVSKIFHVHPYLGKIPNLTNIFQKGLNHQLDFLFEDFVGKGLVFFDNLLSLAQFKGLGYLEGIDVRITFGTCTYCNMNIV